MKDILPKLLVLVSVFLVLSSQAMFAASLTLSKIGVLDTGNKQISGQWWYTPANPVLTGAAVAAATVTIAIDGINETATADANGTWQYTPTTLTNGNHKVSISSDGESFSFMLNIGKGLPEGSDTSTVGESGNPVPITGGAQSLLYMLFTATLLIGGGILIQKRARIRNE